MTVINPVNSKNIATNTDTAGFIAENGKADVRYNLRLPSSIYAQLRVLARENGTTRLELIKRFIKLGILVLETEKDPDSGFFFRKGDSVERVLML